VPDGQQANLRGPHRSLAFNLETLAAQVKKTLELVWRCTVRWVDEKLARWIFHYLRSQGGEVVKFVR
jgi:hypothetical protein